MQPPTAAQRVFGTVELLEKILVSIAEEASPADLRALLVSQRLNSTWRGLIKRNVEIQQALCFTKHNNEQSGALHPYWNNMIWPPRNGNRTAGNAIDLTAIVGNKNATGSWRQMLVKPWTKEQFDAKVVLHFRGGRKVRFWLTGNPHVTMGNFLEVLDRKFDAKKAEVKRLTIRRQVGRIQVDGFCVD